MQPCLPVLWWTRWLSRFLLSEEEPGRNGMDIVPPCAAMSTEDVSSSAFTSLPFMLYHCRLKKSLKSIWKELSFEPYDLTSFLVNHWISLDLFRRTLILVRLKRYRRWKYLHDMPDTAQGGVSGWGCDLMEEPWPGMFKALALAWQNRNTKRKKRNVCSLMLVSSHQMRSHRPMLRDLSIPGPQRLQRSSFECLTSTYPN